MRRSEPDTDFAFSPPLPTPFQHTHTICLKYVSLDFVVYKQQPETF